MKAKLVTEVTDGKRGVGRGAFGAPLGRVASQREAGEGGHHLARLSDQDRVMLVAGAHFLTVPGVTHATLWTNRKH